ncbi:C-reactive protein-like [Notolabrus celidotus]|uniref:C-reactive protein-like n=1 Tax=Notolabrus celidotus TaxID=1203425 RepID=UPI0014901158|nr:C-reactive protein-like [Notolabrus celidotus]
MDFKMELLLLLVLMTSCAAVQDLSGQMFTFPKQTKSSYIRPTTSVRDLSAITVCHRTFTDLKRDHSLFSMSTPSNINAFLIFWDSANKEMEAHVKDTKAEYLGLDYKPNMWHSICTTWDSATGLTQMWFDGVPTIRKFTSTGSSISGSIIIVLGQEQDDHGGSFDINQSLVGMMSDVHIWNYVLSSCEIHKYMDKLNYTPGNVINWRAMEFQTFDKVVVEKEEMTCI